MANARFADAEQRARHLLENPQELVGPGVIAAYSPVFRIWKCPTFDLWDSWHAFVSTAKGTGLGIHVTWDRPSDYERLHLDPIQEVQAVVQGRLGPTMRVDCRDLDPNRFEPILSRVRMLPEELARQPKVIALDGTEYGLIAWTDAGVVRLEIPEFAMRESPMVRESWELARDLFPA